jgi:hypothetical protein
VSFSDSPCDTSRVATLSLFLSQVVLCLLLRNGQRLAVVSLTHLGVGKNRSKRNLRRNVSHEIVKTLLQGKIRLSDLDSSSVCPTGHVI